MRRLFRIAAVAALAACSSSPKPENLLDVKLPTLAGDKAVSLASCPTPKCLTAYVAPWCPHCREATPSILSLRDYLKTQNVTLRVVVGQDKPAALAAYAKIFGPATFLDDNQLIAAEGVPHFYTSDAQGRILKDVAGFPLGLSNIKELAAEFDLP